MKRKIVNFEVEIIDEPIELDSGRKCNKTAIVNKKINGRLVNTSKYGVVENIDLYKTIEEKQPVNIDQCYVKDFELQEYRKIHKLDDDIPIVLKNFSARNTFFEGIKSSGFPYAYFAGEELSFEHSIFFKGDFSFQHVHFDVPNISFNNCGFHLQTVSFQYAVFENGAKNFRNCVFNCEEVSFVNAEFNDGEVNFRDVSFEAEKVNFHFSRFGEGDILFEKAHFDAAIVDFRTVEFGSGKTDFRRVHFENGNVTFEESEFQKGRITFRSSSFEGGSLSFELVDFGDNKVVFDRVLFGSGHTSFAKSTFNTLSLKGSHLDNYLDLRIKKGKLIDLSESIARDIIDLTPNENKVSLDTLKLKGMRDLGRIFIHWKKNDVHKLIASQEDTSIRDKANQFNLLKNDFNDTGQYNDEDKAYVAYKRFEQKADLNDALEKKPSNGVWAYPSYWFKWIVFDKMGHYATDPLRVLVSMFVVYILFSLLFVVLPEFAHADIVSSVGDPDGLSMVKRSFYHSAITFLTIGYGDYYPSGHIRWLSSLEGWVGLFMMAYFTVAFVRKILR